ncbi:putative caffeoyl-CoA O-methyltransferase 2 [Trichoplax sp. H2]|nr:putative caffeoyl-CoA O-methyltransferase 2 [Trichoplax sp. H2]|eukprot:RDD40576.1 putative caffeoyl-CoA O-methyltransferase 2 [Trichoplax sp. H2]
MLFPSDCSFYKYVLKNGYRIHPISQKLLDETIKHPMRKMAASTDEVAFFQFLLPLIQAKKVIEIGVFTGLTTLGMALALPDDAKIVGLDVSEEYVNIGRPFWKEANVDHKIDIKIGLALESLDQLIANNELDSYDFIFIDADKSNYINYYEKSLQLIRKGGVIAIDNTLWSGQVGDESITSTTLTSIREFNNHVKDDSRITFVVLTVCDGVTLVKKN